MEVRAVSRYVRVSPRKARVVVDLVRGKSVEQAREILAFTNRAVAETVEKTLNSAVANAEHNNHLRGDSLVIKAAYVDEGPTLKRIRPSCQGFPLRASTSVPATSPSSSHRERRHKVHGSESQPYRFRLGITEEWRSRWYADKNYAETLENDLAIRKFLEKHLARAAVSKIEIERAGDKVKVIITTARPVS